MNYKYLGRTELKVSPIGLGIGGILGMKIFDEKKALEVIQTAIDNGINFFDTGNSYSYGNAEIRLGKVISNNNRENLVIATKGGTVITKNNKLIKNFSPKSLRKQLEESLIKLKIDVIDLYQLHDPGYDHLTDEVYKTLENFKKEGKIRYTGISTGGKTLEKSINDGFFDTVMVSYNLMTKTNEPFLQLAKDKGLGVLIKSPMAHTLYSNDIFKIKSLSDLWYLLRVMKNFRKRLMKGFKYRFVNHIPGWTGSEIALKFVLDNPNVDVALIGTTNPKHLIENINTARREPLPKDIYDKIQSLP